MLQLLQIIWQVAYFTTLQTWEVWLRGFCIGFFIFGLVIIAIVLFTMGIGGHDTGHDIDHDTDFSIDKDVSIDKDFSIDKDVSVDKDLSIDKDVSIDKDLSLGHDLEIGSADHPTGLFSAADSSPAPLLLLLAVFSITFGGLGLLLFWLEAGMNSYVRLSIIVTIPLISAVLVDQIWRRVAVSQSYRLPSDFEFIGLEAVVVVPVDEQGGTIRVEMPDQLEALKVPAKAVHKHQLFLKEELVFIVGVQGSFFLVDNTRDLLADKSARIIEPKEKEYNDE